MTAPDLPIVAAGPQFPGDDMYRMARHVVDHLGGGGR